jgi:HJR/Mrr/RecB family endonuclease
MGAGQGQVVAAVQSRPNTSLQNAYNIIAAVDANISTDFEALYRQFLKNHVGKGSLMTQALNQLARQQNDPEVAQYYRNMKRRKNAVNREPRV